MTDAVVQRGQLQVGTGDGLIFTSYNPGDTVTTLSDGEIARLRALGVLTDQTKLIAPFEDSGAYQVVDVV